MADNYPGKTSQTAYRIDRFPDSGIEIDFKIPYPTIVKKYQDIIAEKCQNLSKNLPNLANTAQEELSHLYAWPALHQQLISKIINKAYDEVKQNENLKTIMAPRMVPLQTVPDQPWQVKLLTCLAPEFSLPENYKQQIKQLKAKKNLTGPIFDQSTKEQLINEILGSLVNAIKIVLPNILLISKIDQLVINESYRLQNQKKNLTDFLKQTGKTIEQFRYEYKNSAENLLKMELVIKKIAIDQNLEPEIIAALESQPQANKRPEQIQAEQKQLTQARQERQQKVLDFLVNL